MDNTNINNFQENILETVVLRRLKDSFDLLKSVKNNVAFADILEKFDTLYLTYSNILKYSFDSTTDPQRDSIYVKLQQSILELADDLKDIVLKEKYFKSHSLNHAYLIDLKSLSPQEISQTIHVLSLNAREENSQEEGQTGNDTKLINKLFYSLVLSNYYKEPEQELLNKIIGSSSISWRTKSILVSAVTLSLMRHFDREKFFILFDLSQSNEDEVRQRALIGLFLSLIIYHKRLILYSDILNRLRAIPDNAVFRNRFLAVLIQFIKACETEKITRKIQDEIVPEVLKIRSDLEERLHIEDILNKEDFEEKNPDWENLFKDSPDVYNKLEQFSKMQIEGSDVFMGAFAMLKNFKFFNEMANWFAPFDRSCIEITDAFNLLDKEFDKSAFLEGLEQTNVLCNSDKYSFCFNIQYIPLQQQKMMIELFNAELKSMNDMYSDEQKMDSEAKNKIINAQYIQDLYRFFKLNANSKEFIDVFTVSFDIIDSEVLGIIFKEKNIINNLAEYYFANDKYKEALKLFLWLNSKEKSFELLEKTGFCYQKTSDYENAIKSYQQAELFDRHRLWLRKKLGYCYRKIGDFDKAIDQYDLIIKDEPNDLANLVYLGQLYIDKGDFEEALKCYYQIEYESSDHTKAYRPIAWCSFILGKYDNAIKYYLKIVKDKPTERDYLNFGHCYWSAGNISSALESYRNALVRSNNNEKWFRNSFELDRKYLIQKKIDDFEINLMIDYILIR